jgi:hypothetical protein
MKRIIFIIFSSVIFHAATTGAETLLEFKPYLGGGVGFTQYTIDIPAETSNGDDYALKSRLIFRLDALYAGGILKIQSGDTARFEWSLEADLSTNLTNSFMKMKDRDWIEINNSQEFSFSYTESDADFRNTVLFAIGRKHLPGFPGGHFYLMGGYRFQSVRQDIIGYNGWQIDLEDPTLTPVPISGSGKVLIYKVTCHSALAGLSYMEDFGESVMASVAGGYLPTYFEDYDDHLLRFKRSVANGYAHGFMGEASVRFLSWDRMRSKKMFLELSGSFFGLIGFSDQRQEWYGNDPAQEGDETGQIISGIDYEIQSYQLALKAEIGILF